jgi:hypothetical protein
MGFLDLSEALNSSHQSDLEEIKWFSKGMRMTKFGVIAIGVIALVVVGASYCTNNFIGAEKRVKAVCEQIKPGMTIAQLQDFGLAHGLGGLPNPQPGINFMVEKSTAGRYGCKVFLDAGLVKQVEYQFSN